MTTETPVQNTEQTPEIAEKEKNRSQLTFRPVVDIIEKADELLIYADMPGVKADSIDIHFEDRTLSIHGRVEPRQAEKTTYLLQEYGVGDFHRVFQLSEVVDATKITAEYTDGVLVLHLPKVEAVRPRKIEVQIK
jgi:HSP20 family molecular chaperone IbpA